MSWHHSEGPIELNNQKGPYLVTFFSLTHKPKSFYTCPTKSEFLSILESGGDYVYQGPQNDPHTGRGRGLVG